MMFSPGWKNILLVASVKGGSVPGNVNTLIYLDKCFKAHQTVRVGGAFFAPIQ
jgi:hypothetical protein